ncbi:MAG: hypothetical protein CSB16_01315 [Clostridiales bacterium]|nr:MAG: hypothetical protein CSB16_01315 [Clostridiales bacterium]
MQNSPYVSGSKVYSPSFEYEKKTRYFSLSVWAIGALIAFFINALLFFVYSFFIEKYNLIGILRNDISFNLFLSFLLVFPGVIAILKIRATMITSYKIKAGRIIKGKIRLNTNFKRKRKALESRGLLSPKLESAFLERKGSKLSRINKAVLHNTDAVFASEYFDDDEVYTKKTYNNPKFIKETRKYLIFKTDSKKIKIPKVYPELGRGEYSIHAGLIMRAFRKALIILLLINFIIITDITYHSNKYSDRFEVAISQNQFITEGLSKFSYHEYESSDHMSLSFSKTLENGRISIIDYYRGIDGRIETVDAVMVFEGGDKSALEEVKFFVKTLPYTFDEKEMDFFYSKLQESIDGNRSTFRIFTSGDVENKYWLTLSPYADNLYQVYFRKDI